MRIVFLHPDLGIGGAERLVVDAALSLKSRGHSVRFLTSHHDSSHCFAETRRPDILDVTVAGDFWPRRLFGRWCYALCAYWRMIWLALYLCLWSGWKYDVLFVDQVSACIPILQLFKRNRKAKVLFYCHFPDMLLTQRKSLAKKIYRRPLDALEEWSTGLADRVLVNSSFTETVFRSTFRSLASTHVTVLRPPVNETAFSGPSPTFPSEIMPPNRRWSYFLSLNRYERKKDVGLAVRALAVLQTILKPEDFQRVHLVIAGGYDPNLPENVDHYVELNKLVATLQLTDHVTFLKSPSDGVKRALLENCRALLYTPEREHFGIVPLEAMFCGRPVIALRSGGPKETVVDGVTGYLVPVDDSDTAQIFADRLATLANDSVLADEFGRRGRERAVEKFSFEAFAASLDELCQELVPQEAGEETEVVEEADEETDEAEEEEELQPGESFTTLK